MRIRIRNFHFRASYCNNLEVSAKHQMAGLSMASQGFATLSNLDMQQCPKIFCNFVQKVLAKNTIKNFLYELLFGNSNLTIIENMVKESNLDIDSFLQSIMDEDLLKGTTGEKLYNEAFIKKAKGEIGLKCQQLILELTGACNFRCKYCIYSSTEKGFREFNSENMSEDIIRKSINYMRDYGEDVVYVTFYGGEPLVKFDLMKFAIDYAIKEITNKKLYFGFTTNLTLMDKEIASYLVHIPNLNIICSIDGPEEIHDASRVYIDGKGTYKDAIRGYNILKEELEKIQNPSISINFNAVYMVPYDIAKLSKIDESFQELCAVTSASKYNITYPTAGTIPKELKEYEVSDNSMWEWMRQVALECDDLLKLKNRGIVDSLTTVHKRVITKSAATVMPMNGCCIPGARRLYIDTKGDMYVCERINISPKIGNIFSGVDEDIIYKKYFYEYSDQSIEHCTNCWAAKICPVCYANRMDMNGISPDAHQYCGEFRDHLKEQFVLYYEILEKDPKKLEPLNNVITR